MKYLYMIACLLLFSVALVSAQDHDAGEDGSTKNPGLETLFIDRTAKGQ